MSKAKKILKPIVYDLLTIIYTAVFFVTFMTFAVLFLVIGQAPQNHVININSYALYGLAAPSFGMALYFALVHLDII